MIIGTAGHIDHGKTSLVRALTGVETDRLKEEKARGISIELGFAYWPQADGSRIGFVDVPGHEALVHTMLAGATGIDVVLLVVAADDGVMPQTREHLAIMDLLGLSRGVVALNKADRVGPERLAAAEAEVGAALASTGLAAAPIVPVSAITGSGLEALKSALLAARGADRTALGGHLFRLAVDRAFTLKGLGTTVTGVVLSGSVGVDDEVVVSPRGVRARVRSMHAQNVAAAHGKAGQRCALVLSGIDKDDVQRGDMIVAPQLHVPTARIDVELHILMGEPKPIGTWFPVKLHHGAAEVPARIVPLAPETLAPGQTGLAQIVLERSIAAFAGDRFVIRDTSSSRTVGGGVLLDVRAPERRRRTPERLAELSALKSGEAADNLRVMLEGPRGWLNASTFLRDRGLREAVLADIPAAADATRLDTGEGIVLVSSSAWRSLVEAIGAALDRAHAEQPDQPGIPKERLRTAAPVRLPITVFNAALERMTRDKLLVVDRSWIRRPSHQIRFSEQEEALWRHIWPRLIREPYRPPRVRDIAKAMEIDEALVRRLAKLAQRRGDVEEIAHDHFYARSVVERIAAIARECAAASPTGDFSAADLRDKLDNGRKVAIQILEFFDRHGYTIRRKDLRRINPHRAELFTPPGSADTQVGADQTADQTGGVPLPVGRPDFKSGWGRQTASGGFDSHPPPPLDHTARKERSA